MSRRFLAGWTCTWAPDAQTPNCLSENRDEHLLSWIIFVFHSLNFYEWISFCTSRVGGKTFTGRIGGWKKVPFQNFRKTELSKRLLIFQWLQQSAGLFSKRTRWAPIPRPAGHSWFLWQLHPPSHPVLVFVKGGSGSQRRVELGWEIEFGRFWNPPTHNPWNGSGIGQRAGLLKRASVELAARMTEPLWFLWGSSGTPQRCTSLAKRDALSRLTLFRQQNRVCDCMFHFGYNLGLTIDNPPSSSLSPSPQRQHQGNTYNLCVTLLTRKMMHVMKRSFKFFLRILLWYDMIHLNHNEGRNKSWRKLI